MEDNSLFFWLGVVANMCQIESYQMLLKDANNNQLMRFLEHQDADYLTTIINQNKQLIQQNQLIIELLKEGNQNGN